LLDFGVAKLLDEDLPHKTATGAAIGTPSYMAPEQCRGRSVDYRADIYALGVVIHEVLTGRRLFDADSGMDVLIKHVSEPPPSMSSVCPDLPEALDAPVLAMLAKRPDDRPRSAGVAVAALAERARANGLLGADSKDAAPPVGSFEQELARREAPTVKDAHPPAEDVPTVPKGGQKKPPSDGAQAVSVEPSGAVVVSVDVDVTAPDHDSTKARTMLAAVSPASGTLLSAAPPSAAVRPSVPEATLADTAAAPPPAPPAERRAAAPARSSRAWPYAAAVAVVAAAVALFQRSNDRARPGHDATTSAESAPPPASATAVPASTTVTIRLAVTPPDADVLLDSLRVGSASDPLVLPRSGQSRAIRIEKPGYEGQPLVIIPDRDLDLGPIALRPAPVPSSTTPASPPVRRPAATAGDHPDLDRPSQLKPPR
jgi:serine/threonine-protein kinase